MNIFPITHALPFCSAKEEQTAYSRNLRITAVAIGIILLLVGIGSVAGIFGLAAPIGWACLSIGIIAVATGLCLRCLKNQQPSDQNLSGEPTINGVDRANESNYQSFAKMNTHTETIQDKLVKEKANFKNQVYNLHKELTQLVEKLKKANELEENALAEMKNLREQYAAKFVQLEKDLEILKTNFSRINFIFEDNNELSDLKNLLDCFNKQILDLEKEIEPEEE